MGDFQLRKLFRVSEDLELKASGVLRRTLWRVLDDMPAAGKRRLLAFLTGVGRRPAAGAEALRVEMPFVAIGLAEQRLVLQRLPQVRARERERELESERSWRARASERARERDNGVSGGLTSACRRPTPARIPWSCRTTGRPCWPSSPRAGARQSPGRRAASAGRRPSAWSPPSRRDPPSAGETAGARPCLSLCPPLSSPLPFSLLLCLSLSRILSPSPSLSFSPSLLRSEKHAPRGPLTAGPSPPPGGTATAPQHTVLGGAAVPGRTAPCHPARPQPPRVADCPPLQSAELPWRAGAAAGECGASFAAPFPHPCIVRSLALFAALFSSHPCSRRVFPRHLWWHLAWPAEHRAARQGGAAWHAGQEQRLAILMTKKFELALACEDYGLDA